MFLGVELVWREEDDKGMGKVVWVERMEVKERGM